MIAHYFLWLSPNYGCSMRDATVIFQTFRGQHCQERMKFLMKHLQCLTSV